ncbi:hypothetical protein BRADI_3g27150v3 [Brachypodium distachyon]|uniref:SMP domain-containing protein n=2 Tax=Brachypodium distachyon TaxID=15368 RepID=I1I460_BRADI|nr:hypothetical protein BRADI_3g27150v3 [Brachypodium distachyon]
MPVPGDEHDEEDEGSVDGPVRYGDVFAVHGELAGAPIAPQDAATMQAAESAVLGRTPKSGPASVMQSAAARNVRAGAVAHGEATGAAAELGVTVSETRVPGGRIFTEFVAGQHVGQEFVSAAADEEASLADGTKITMGEALEATAFSAGEEPVEASDAAAIEAAEARVNGATPAAGSLAARARAAADANAVAEREEDKTRLRDVLADATVKLGADKEVEREDAARVVGAEVRGKPDATARPGGVGASVAAAARLNTTRL